MRYWLMELRGAIELSLHDHSWSAMGERVGYLLDEAKRLWR